MSTGLYSHTTRATGTVLTASIYNADHQNHITNLNPTMTGGYADNLSQYQIVTDPGGLGTESLPSSLAGELERIRFAIKRITGEAQWYVAPAIALSSVGGTITDLVVSETIRFTGNLSPAQITSNQADYAPTGHADAFRFRVNSDASRSVTGLAGGASGRIVVWTNIGSFNIALKNEDASSSAANRFALGSHMTVFPGQSVALEYDSTSSRWRPFDTAGYDNETILGYGDYTEIAVPSNPAADNARLYAKDVAGVTKLAYKNSAGTEIVISAAYTPPATIIEGVRLGTETSTAFSAATTYKAGTGMVVNGFDTVLVPIGGCPPTFAFTPILMYHKPVQTLTLGVWTTITG